VSWGMEKEPSLLLGVRLEGVVSSRQGAVLLVPGTGGAFAYTSIVETKGADDQRVAIMAFERLLLRRSRGSRCRAGSERGRQRRFRPERPAEVGLCCKRGKALRLEEKAVGLKSPREEGPAAR
jgi:hypothetical protein